MNHLKSAALMLLLSIAALIEWVSRTKPREPDDEWRID
jgi:hypothetical protein